MSEAGLFHARLLDELSSSGGLTAADVANMVGVSKAMISRWRTGEMNPRPSEGLTLSRVYYLILRLREHYEPRKIRARLYARHVQLSGESAIDRIHQGRILEVLPIVARIDGAVSI